MRVRNFGKETKEMREKVQRRDVPHDFPALRINYLKDSV
jgi:hypothetical protein